ncbi:glycosyltransferase family 4 protein [Hwangdonia lutea]|uniref:Glycosyltransferase family 4 protein n=1 Tax=Hwangdonia lutea TaxID=3075823 RepID=A0AA97HQH7_9FLAO|nr:glycosyltransferase family 4 protein [Hwangdonia sp. SCSIO 19198]WOD43966.1 glycosyltransferase family 4 protein [Hwangdonia sp. SCSIO 19198]
MKKRIAVICNYELFEDRVGGMDRFYVAYDAKAKALGYKVDWFFSNHEAFDFFKNLNIYSPKGQQSVETFFKEFCSQNNKEYSVVMTHFIELCTPFYKWLKDYHKAYVLAVDHNPRPLHGFPLKKRLKNRLKGLWYSKYIDKFIAVSKYTKKHILNDYGHFLDNKTIVVYNGIDVEGFKKRIINNKNKFIVASHLRESKGIQDLISAVSLLDDDIKKQIKIDVYGKGPHEEFLKALTKKLALEHCINFKGSSSKLHELFCNYAYMLQPTYMECFSLSILESLSANVPVITTQVGGNLEVITHEDNGFIYLAGDVEALSNIIENIVFQKSAITKDVSTLVEKEYYLDKMVKQHIKLLPCT